MDLREAIESRVSVRRYASTPLSMAELSYLLWCTQGVKQVEGSYVALFSDEDMNRLLDLDGEERFVIYIATVGKKE